MAFPTAVNNQITDSVTQANVKVLSDAPALAMANLYQATAQALANAAHNATTSQQQSYVTAQAATTMGVATLYSIDTATTGVATKELLGLSVAPQALVAVPQGLSTTLASDTVTKTLQDAIESVHNHHFEDAEAWAKAVKDIFGAVSYALTELQQVARNTNMDTIKQAALTVTLSHLIHAPEQVEQYEKIINLIKEL